MQIETFTLILNSSDATNIINNSSIKAYSYSINWEAVIPKSKIQNYEASKFNVYFSFVSNIATTNLSLVNSAYISANFGKSNSIDNRMTQTNLLGFLQPIVYSKYSNYPTNTITDYYQYYIANNQDNSPTTISYPHNSQIIITIADTDSSYNAVNIGNYILKLTFEQII
jgi:hypothetical protein